MPTTFYECGPEVTIVAGKLIERYYPDLVRAGVTITYLFASNVDAIGGCLKHGGYPAAAIVKRNSLQDRVEGKADCTIKIDKEWWDGHSETERAALIDHELYHILVAEDDEGTDFILDDIDRPKIELRKHDFQIGGFDEIAKRHGPNAEEVKAILAVNEQWQQMELNFGHWG
jgi:hypothetical protein